MHGRGMYTTLGEANSFIKACGLGPGKLDQIYARLGEVNSSRHGVN